MSELPQIDPKVLIRKLLSKNSDLNLEVTQLETLAEALRDQRDQLQGELDQALGDLETLRQGLVQANSESAEVHTITDL